MILFHSTNGQSPPVNLREALLTGQAPDQGLYLPQQFPGFSPPEIAAFARLSYPAIAFAVLRRYTAGVVADTVLEALCREAYDFPVPLEPVRGLDRVCVMRLDQGPTARSRISPRA